MKAVLSLRLPLLALFALLAGCAQSPVQGLPGRQALLATREITQQLEARWKNQSGSLLSIISTGGGQLDFLATTLLGQEVFHLRYDGVKAQLLSRSDALPKQLRTDYLLRDLIWAQWPAQELQPALTASGLTLEEKGQLREIRDTHGQLALRITRDDRGGFHIENPRFGYQLDLSSVTEDATEAKP